MNVFKVGHPSAWIKAASETEITGLKIWTCIIRFVVVHVVCAVVIDIHVLVQVVLVHGIFCGIPKSKCCCSCVVDHVRFARATRIESSKFIGRLVGAFFIGRYGSHHFFIDVFGCIQELLCILWFIDAPTYSKIGESGGIHAGRRSDSLCDVTVRTAFGLRLCILLFWNVPELVVRISDGDGMVHVALIDKSFCLRR